MQDNDQDGHEGTETENPFEQLAGLIHARSKARPRKRGGGYAA